MVSVNVLMGRRARGRPCRGAFHPGVMGGAPGQVLGGETQRTRRVREDAAGAGGRGHAGNAAKLSRLRGGRRRMERDAAISWAAGAAIFLSHDPLGGSTAERFDFV